MELQVFPFEREDAFERVLLLMSREAVNEGRGEEIVKGSVKRGGGKEEGRERGGEEKRRGGKEEGREGGGEGKRRGGKEEVRERGRKGRRRGGKEEGRERGGEGKRRGRKEKKLNEEAGEIWGEGREKDGGLDAVLHKSSMIR